MERTELRDKMFDLVKLWSESGDSQHDFAEKHQISPSKFKYWIRKANGQAAVEPAFIPLFIQSQLAIAFCVFRTVWSCMFLQVLPSTRFGSLSAAKSYVFYYFSALLFVQSGYRHA